MPSAAKKPVNVSAFIRAQPLDMPAIEVLKKLKEQHGIVKQPDLVWSVRKVMRKKGRDRKAQGSAPKTPSPSPSALPQALARRPVAPTNITKMVRSMVFRYGYESVVRELDKLKKELS